MDSSSLSGLPWARSPGLGNSGMAQPGSLKVRAPLEGFGVPLGFVQCRFRADLRTWGYMAVSKNCGPFCGVLITKGLVCWKHPYRYP